MYILAKGNEGMRRTLSGCYNIDIEVTPSGYPFRGGKPETASLSPPAGKTVAETGL